MHTVKWFQVLLSKTNSSIGTQLHDLKYCHLTLVILFIKFFQSNLKLIICLHTVKWFQVLLFNTNNYLILMLIYRIRLDSPTWPIQVLSFWVRVQLGVMIMEGYSTFPKLKNWSFTIRWSLMSDSRFKMVWGIAI